MNYTRPLTLAALLVAALAALVPTDADAYPSGAWRTRNTGLDTEGKCTRRAFRALKNADLDTKASGNIGVVGTMNSEIVYVICLNNGALAAVFCSSDRKEDSGRASAGICDKVTRFMAD